MTRMSRALMGYIVDEVFDGAIEDTKVIEDIYAAIKRHEALSASPAGVVKPKPLVWRKLYEDSNAWPVTWHGAGILGKIYPVEQYSPNQQFYTLGKGYDTLEAAKDAAFADYSARIMSAIEPAGVGVETVVKAADDAIVSAVFMDFRNGVAVGDQLLDHKEVRFRVEKAIRNALKGDEQ